MHLHNCPSKPSFWRYKGSINPGSWSVNHHLVITTNDTSQWCFVQSKDCLWSEPVRKTSLESGVGVRDSDGWEALHIFKTRNLLYHNALQPVWVRKNIYIKKVEKKSSLTTLINTKGYPILYTVVCDICGPYKMLSLSIDFVLILSWCIKYQCVRTKKKKYKKIKRAI